MNQRYSPEDLFDLDQVYDGIRAEADLIETQGQVKRGLRSLFSDLKGMAIRDGSFKLPDVRLANGSLSGYSLWWCEEGGSEKKKIDLYRLEEEELYLVAYEVTSDKENQNSKFVVDFAHNAFDPQISRFGEEVPANLLWGQLSEILDSLS